MTNTLERMGPEIKSEYIDMLIKKLWLDIELLSRYQGGETFDQIASNLGCEKSTVYSSFRRLVGAKLFEASLPEEEEEETSLGEEQ